MALISEELSSTPLPSWGKIGESIKNLLDEPRWNPVDVISLSGGEKDESEEGQYTRSILNDDPRWYMFGAPMVQKFQPKATIYKDQNELTLTKIYAPELASLRLLYREAKPNFRNIALSTPRRPKWENQHRHIQLTKRRTRTDEALFSGLVAKFGSFVTDFGIGCKKDVKTTPSLWTNDGDQRQQLTTKRGRAIIRNMAKFDCIDRQLEVDEALSEELRYILLHEMENEPDHKRCIWGALNYLMTTKLASKFDWSGKNGKRSFRFTTLRRVLFDAVRVRFPRETDYDLHHPVQKWLQAAVALNQRQHATQDSMVIGGRSRKSLIPQRLGCGSVKNSKVLSPQKRRGQRSNKQKGHCDTCHPIAIL